MNRQQRQELKLVVAKLAALLSLDVRAVREALSRLATQAEVCDFNRSRKILLACFPVTDHPEVDQLSNEELAREIANMLRLPRFDGELAATLKQCQHGLENKQ